MNWSSQKLFTVYLIMPDICVLGAFFFFLAIKLLNMAVVRGFVFCFIYSLRLFKIVTWRKYDRSYQLWSYPYMRFSVAFDDKLNNKCVELKEHSLPNFILVNRTKKIEINIFSKSRFWALGEGICGIFLYTQITNSPSAPLMSQKYFSEN